MDATLHFDPRGMLPAGEHALTFADVRRSVLVVGPPDYPGYWDTPWRSLLVDNLEVLVRQLWAVGIERVVIGGSFVERNPHPNDIDGVFYCPADDFVVMHRRLNRLDPEKTWTWQPYARRQQPTQPNHSEWPMRRVYRVQLFPELQGVSEDVRAALFGATRLVHWLPHKKLDADTPRGVVRIVRS